MRDPLVFLLKCSEAEGKPYRWAGKGPDDFDCSGLVTWALHETGGKDWRATHSSARLFAELEPTTSPQPGDLAFYGGPGRINHVMVVWSDGRVFGACGGDSTTTTREAASLRNAKVKFKSSAKYRPDLRGYRRLP